MRRLMRWLTSILFFRCLFIISNIIFVFKVCDEFYFEYTYEAPTTESPPQSIQWSSFHLEMPPHLNDWKTERMRLNELLAVKQYQCQKPKAVGSENERYTVCEELGEIGAGFTITGDVLSSGDLEKDLNATSWTVFLPEECKLIEKLNVDVEVNYLTQLADWDHWHTWDVEQSVKGRAFGAAKFDLYSTHFRSHDQPKFIRDVIKLMEARHLLLTIDVGAWDSENNTTVVGSWYRLLYWMFFDLGYAIIGATPNGVCGTDGYVCRYRVSLAKVGHAKMISAPVFGFGSPLEERRRLEKSITSKNVNCHLVDEHDFPPFCSKTPEPDNKVIVLRYHSVDGFILPEFLRKARTTHIVTPYSETPIDGVKIHSFGITNSNGNKSVDRKWDLIQLDVILDRISENSTIDILVLDMDGGEWDVLEALLKYAETRNITQIIIRGRIFVEEGENYRRFYWSLRKFYYQKYKRTYGKIDNETRVFHLGLRVPDNIPGHNIVVNE